MDHIPGPWNLPADEPIVIQYPVETNLPDVASDDILAVFDPSHPVSMLIRALPDLLEACLEARTALEAAVGDEAQFDAAIETITKAVEIATLPG